MVFRESIEEEREEKIAREEREGKKTNKLTVKC